MAAVAPYPYPPFAVPREVDSDLIASWVVYMGGEPAQELLRGFVDDERYPEKLAGLYSALAEAALRVRDLPRWLNTPLDMDAPGVAYTGAVARRTADRLNKWEQEMRHEYADRDDDSLRSIATSSRGGFEGRTHVDALAELASRGCAPADLIRAGYWTALADYVHAVDQLLSCPTRWGDSWSTGSYELNRWVAPELDLTPEDWPSPLMGDDPWELLPSDEQREIDARMNELFPAPAKDEMWSDAQVIHWAADLTGLDPNRIRRAVGARPSLDDAGRWKLEMLAAIAFDAWCRCPEDVRAWWASPAGREVAQAVQDGYLLDAGWAVAQLGPSRRPPLVRFSAADDQWAVRVYSSDTSGPEETPAALTARDLSRSTDVYLGDYLPMGVWHQSTNDVVEDGFELWACIPMMGDDRTPKELLAAA